MRFGEHIRTARKRIGFSQQRLAEEAGYSPQYICDIEKSRRPVPDNLIPDLAKGLGEDETLIAVWAGRLPPELRDLTTEESKVLVEVLNAFMGKEKDNEEEGTELPEQYDKAKKLALIAEAKKGGCVLCGSIKLLHFHHVRPTDKLFNIQQEGVKQNTTRLKVELEKCVVLCTPCHMRVHKGLVAPSLLDLREPSTTPYEEQDPYVLEIGKALNE